LSDLPQRIAKLSPEQQHLLQILLKEHQADALQQDSDCVAPRTLVEEWLVGLWASIFRVKRVGIQDSFLELGGNSLLATQVISQIREIFQVDLPVSSLFEVPTIAELAKRVEAARQATQSSQAPPLHRRTRTRPPSSP